LLPCQMYAQEEFAVQDNTGLAGTSTINIDGEDVSSFEWDGDSQTTAEIAQAIIDGFSRSNYTLYRIDNTVYFRSLNENGVATNEIDPIVINDGGDDLLCNPKAFEGGKYVNFPVISYNFLIDDNRIVIESPIYGGVMNFTVDISGDVFAQVPQLYSSANASATLTSNTIDFTENPTIPFRDILVGDTTNKLQTVLNLSSAKTFGRFYNCRIDTATVDNSTIRVTNQCILAMNGGIPPVGSVNVSVSGEDAYFTWEIIAGIMYITGILNFD